MNRLLLALAGMSLMGGWAALAATGDPSREIFPIPRVASYQAVTVPVGPVVTLMVDSAFAQDKIRLMADDFSTYLAERYGHSLPVVIANAPAAAGVTIRLLRWSGVGGALAEKLLTPPYLPAKLPRGPRRAQAFLIRSFLAEQPPVIYVVSDSEQGLYYAVMAVAQLVRFEPAGPAPGYTVRGADVLDWPAFEARVTGEPRPNEHAPAALQQASIRFKAGILRSTHGWNGQESDPNSQHPYALARWLKVGGNYYASGPDCQPPLTPYNWSDPDVVKKHAERAASFAGRPGDGSVWWHDGTDAGWWHFYLDTFWAKRDAVDRKNYPTDPTPARADAARFAAMFQAIRKASPQCDIFLTLPCYYDNPENDQLPRIGLFRDYLRTVGASVPASMKDRVWFILEERSPASVAAYQKYLGTKVCNFRYSECWHGSSWETNYSSAKDLDGIADGFMFDEWNELTFVVAAQYLWNPDLPTDEAWIRENVAPRAARLLFGDAWKPMLDFTLLNLNGQNLVRERDLKQLVKEQKRVAQAEQWLDAAEKRVPERCLHSRELVVGGKKWVADLKKTIAGNLDLVRQQIPLEKATVRSDVPGIAGYDNLKGALLGQCRWMSPKTPGPHWVEITLPQPYLINQMCVGIPGDWGYSWVDAEVQAEVFGSWISVAKFGKAEERPLNCAFDDLRTAKLRILLHTAYDWDKKTRSDLQFNGLKLFGTPLPQDPSGVERLDGRWQFRLDPAKQGVKEAWFARREFKDGWTSIPVPSYFNYSGLPGTASYNNGWAWYARTFSVPPAWKNGVVKIRFEAVDDEADVWLNGKLVGKHHKTNDPTDIHWFEAPFLFDISAAVNRTGPNTLVVLVNNLQGPGGIWKSVLIHLGDGPSLVAKDKNTK